MGKRSICRLTAVECEKFAQPGKLLSDGGNLYLSCSRSGSKSWIFRYVFQGRQRDYGLGGYPAVKLIDARDMADGARKLLRDGIDPLEERKTLAAEAARKVADAARAEAVSAITFEKCALEFIAAKESGWRNDKHRQQWRNTLATYAFPSIGKKPVDEVTHDDVLSILRPIWSEKSETAGRLRGRIEKVLSYARHRKWRSGPNVAIWRDGLEHELPALAKVRPEKKPHACLHWEDVPKFVAVLRERDGIAARAFELLILSALRTSELIETHHSAGELDLKRALWTLPAQRMKIKSGGDHRIPLTPRMLEIINSAPILSGNPYLFPGERKGRPLSNMSFLMLLRRMNYGHVTAHGFRSSFKDFCREGLSGYEDELSEIALHHRVGSAVRTAYARSDLLERRRALMQAWEDHCLSRCKSVETPLMRAEA